MRPVRRSMVWAALAVAAAGQTRFVALTTPKHAEPITLDLDRAPMRAVIPLDTAPSEESLRLEIVRLEGQFPPQEFKPGKVIAPKGRDPQSGRTMIVLKQANTPEVGLEVGFLARAKSATVEVKPIFQFTGQPPVDARQRFLKPDALTPPRQINPEISLRTERAILWAMELHPSQRPETIEIFRQYLFGTKELPPRPMLRSRRAPSIEVLLAPPESILLGVSAVLALLSLIATLGR